MPYNSRILPKSLHTATHCNTLQYTAKHCNKLQHTATHCNTLQHTATHFNPIHLLMCIYTGTLPHGAPITLQHTATHCNTLQHTTTHCNTLQPNSSVDVHLHRHPSPRCTNYPAHPPGVCMCVCMCVCECASMCGCVYVFLCVSVRGENFRDEGNRQSAQERARALQIVCIGFYYWKQ